MMTRRRSLWLLAGLLLAAFALRVYRLDTQSLWWDEGISLHLATSSAAEIVRDRLNNIHPPLYFFLLKGWLALTGVSAFSGRYLSALASLMQVALVYAVVKRASTDFTDDTDEERTSSARSVTSMVALLAAGLMLISPLSVIYGQEIRVYALLPVAYLAMLWLAHRLLARPSASEDADSKQERPPAPPLSRSLAPLLLLAALESLALHLHYIALFAVGYIGLWGVLTLGRRREWAGLRRWLAAHALVGAAGLPWLLAVAANLPAIQAEAAAGTFTTEPVPLPYLFAQVWAFHLTGLAGALANPWVRVGAAVAGVLAAVLLLLRSLDLTGFERTPVRQPVRSFTAHWLAPLLPALLVWSVRSFSHPRYVVMFAALFVPLAAWLMGPTAAGRRPTARLLGRLLAPMLALALVALSLWGLRQYFFVPATAKPDMRGVARHLEAVAGPDDLILIPDTDWSLPFEYHGPTPVRMPRLDKSPDETDATLTGLLDCAGEEPCAASGRVFVVDYPDGTRDWAGRLPFELARRGYRAGETRFEGLLVRQYQLTEQHGPLPTCDSSGLARPGARFGPLELVAAWVGQGAAADTAVTVALCWRAAELPPADLAVSLVLRDPLTGERVAQTDALLLDHAGAPASAWPAGATIVTYHVLPLPPGTPPVTAELSAGIYAGKAGGALEAVGATGTALGQFAPLGEVTLSPPVGLSE
uniref:glycosyltransferase family 39 protein n=1 Tax=Promineifilum sp. TaxID=2664178 RepID=UPI0035B36AAE